MKMQLRFKVFKGFLKYIKLLQFAYIQKHVHCIYVLISELGVVVDVYVDCSIGRGRA